MRKIKFRMWDEEEQQMIGGDSLAFEEYTPISHLLNQEGIMEYSEIKDKKRIELYEYDIVRLETPTGYYRLQAYGIPEKNAHNELFVVVKLNCGFVLRHISFMKIKDTEAWDMPNWVHKGWDIIDNYTFWNLQSQFIKVGNIYEQPHFIDGEGTQV